MSYNNTSAMRRFTGQTRQERAAEPSQLVRALTDEICSDLYLAANLTMDYCPTESGRPGIAIFCVSYRTYEVRVDDTTAAISTGGRPIAKVELTSPNSLPELTRQFKLYLVKEYTLDSEKAARRSESFAQRVRDIRASMVVIGESKCDSLGIGDVDNGG